MDILPVVCKKPVTLEAIKDYPGFQVVSPRLVAGREHLEFAIQQAPKCKAMVIKDSIPVRVLKIPRDGASGNRENGDEDHTTQLCSQEISHDSPLNNRAGICLRICREVLRIPPTDKLSYLGK